MTRLLIVALFLGCTIPAYAQDTLYFDQDWNPSTKDHYAYFRPLPLKTLGELSLIRDYHKNGNLQMQGYVRSDNEEYYVGDVYWYDEQGFDKGTRQYFNHSNQKDLTYYHSDGSTWLAITYNERGKKQQVDTYFSNTTVLSGSIDEEQKRLSGSFPSALYADHRLTMYHSVVSPDERGSSVPPVDVRPQEAIDVVHGKEELHTAFAIVTLWQNGNKATEITYGYRSFGYAEKMTQTSWEEDNKLLSKIDFQKNNYQDPKLYHEITYYTQNSFAVHTASFVPMYQYARQEKAIFYYPNGNAKTEEVYDEGGELSKITSFHEDGTVDYVSSYQNSRPYDGRFSISIGLNRFVYHMIDGVEQGEAYLQNPESGEILEQGEYKDGVPYQGIIYLTNGFAPIHRASYKDGLLHGLQTLLSNDWHSDIIETYEMRNGKRDGERIIYHEGKPLYKSLYMDDRLQSGTVSEKRDILSYEGGQLIERKVRASPYEEIYQLVEKYEKGVPQSVTYSSFTVAEKPQDNYVGLFKNGKPFEGYFALDTLLDDIQLIDYYENGMRKYQYYFEFLDQLDSHGHYVYDLKTTYDLQGNIIDGISHRLVDKNSLFITHHVAGKPIRLDMNVFAMHYFNRLTIKIEEEAIVVTDMQSPTVMKLHPEGDFITASIFEEGELVNTRALPQEVDEGSASSITAFYLEGDDVKTYSVDAPAFESTGLDLDNKIVSQLFFLFPIKTDEPLPALFEKLMDVVQSENEEEWYNQIKAYSPAPFTDENYLGYIQYDENKAIHTGIRPTIKSDQSVLLEGIFDGKVVLAKEVKSLEVLRKDQSAVFQDFLTEYYELLTTNPEYE